MQLVGFCTGSFPCLHLMTGEIVHALGALGKPDDLIGVAVFLALAASAFVNRQIL
jgi:hypothetical protein